MEQKLKGRRIAALATASASSPQVNEPLQIVLQAMRWMPRPSFRTIGLIALGFALFAPEAAKKCLGFT
jgi:hypothetical protein